MSRDLRQAAVDFNKNIGLYPLYSETSPDHQTRYLFWRLPKGAVTEIRSGRQKECFDQFDQVNLGRNIKLLSLHVNESDIYSAIWISADFYEEARSVLRTYGITSAEKKEVV